MAGNNNSEEDHYLLIDLDKRVTVLETEFRGMNKVVSESYDTATYNRRRLDGLTTEVGKVQGMISGGQKMTNLLIAGATLCVAMMALFL